MAKWKWAAFHPLGNDPQMPLHQLPSQHQPYMGFSTPLELTFVGALQRSVGFYSIFYRFLEALAPFFTWQLPTTVRPCWHLTPG
jgi:hypothetical protein